MSTLYVAVGMPGAGKSTFIDRKVDEGVFDRADVISTDDLRVTYCGNRADQSRNAEVFQMADAATWVGLSSGRSIWFDSTALTVQARQSVTENARLTGSDLVWCRFDVPVEVLLERNRTREHKVPVEVLSKMAALYAEIPWGNLPGRVLEPAAVSVMMDHARKSLDFVG